MKRIRGALAFAALSAIVVAACSGTGGGSVGPSLPTTVGEGEGELNMVIWGGYAERGAVDPNFDWVTPFEEETGCKVNTTDQTDSSNAVALMQSGDYDGGAFSGNATGRLMAAGTVAPINTDLIPNYANVFDTLKNKVHNSKDGQAYGVPHGRGPNLLMYNTDEIPSAPTSWDPVWDGSNGGKVSVYDSSDFIADAAIHLMQKQPDLGITNPYQLNDAQFAAAIALLEQQRDAGALYWGTYSDQIASYAAGDVVVGTSWQFQVNLMQAEGSPIAGVLPNEGSTGWSDTWMIHSAAKHPNCMYKWMNHMASAEANGQATVWFGEAATSQAACDYAETIAPGHCELTHATDEAFYDKIWYWTTPQADCADADAATTCKDNDAWVAAWTALRGN